MRNTLLSLSFFLSCGEPLLANHNFTEDEIKYSSQSIRRVFEGNYNNDEIKLYEANNQRPIGMASCIGNKATFVYRGTYGLPELTSSINKQPVLLNKMGFKVEEGSGHQGYCIAFNSFRKSIVDVLSEHVKKEHTSLNDLDIRINGYSRGAAFSSLTALSIKEDNPGANIGVITFAGANIFDEMGATIYNSLLGNDHLSFVAKEDVICQYSNLSTIPLGQHLEFSADVLDDYKKRVSEEVYTDLDPSITQTLRTPWGKMGLSMLGGIAQFLTPPIWEAHADKTYQIGAPLAFRGYLQEKK